MLMTVTATTSGEVELNKRRIHYRTKETLETLNLGVSHTLTRCTACQYATDVCYMNTYVIICPQRAECICLVFCSELYLSRWEAANFPVPPHIRNKVLRGPKLSSAVFVDSQLTATPCAGKLEPCSIIGKYSPWFHRATVGFAL